MMYALFISCMLGMSGEQHCQVSVADMEGVAADTVTCLQEARQMQDQAREITLRGVSDVVGGRKEVSCGSPSEILSQANAEYALLRSKGIPTELSFF